MYEVVFLSIIVCIVSFWIRWRLKRMNLFRKYGIPGPKPNFITGNIKEFHEKRNKCIDEWIEKYGNIFGFYFGAKPYIICTDVDFIKTVQIKEFSNFTNKDLVLPDGGVPHKLFTKFLELEKDEKWKNLRTILSTSFSSGKIKMMSKLVDEPIKIFLKKIERQKDEYFNILAFYKKLTFDVICRSALGITTNVQNNETNKFVQAAYNVFEVDSSDILSVLSICFPEFEPIPTTLRRLIDVLRNMMNLPCARVLFEICKQMVESRKKSDYRPPDLLQIMLDAEGDSNAEEKKLSNDVVISNAVGFMLAGYETTSFTLGWCTHYLSHYPDIQDKMRREINQNVKENESVQYSDLMNLKYMDQVISETLRLRPSAVILINRVCAEDFKYKDITIPKGSIVIIPTPHLQKHPNYWPEPEKFDPERFSPENYIDPFIYQPFGAGPRICIGMRLAKTIVKLTLSNLIRSFELEPHGDLELEEEHAMFLSHPKNGIIVKAVSLDS